MIKIKNTHPAPNYINGIVSNPYNNQNKNQVGGSSQPSSKNSRSRSLITSTHLSKKPQLVKSSFNHKESRKLLNNLQNSTERGQSINNTEQENCIKEGGEQKSSVDVPAPRVGSK